MNKALLIGLNYTHVEHETALTGCVHDTQRMKKFLLTNGFKNENIVVLNDENIDDMNKVTWSGIVLALHDLCVSSWKDNLSSVVFHYSGHGRQIKDLDGDEEDGLDEGIVPVDYNIHSVITDDVMNRIFSNFNPHTRITCIFDCCHSGTILDLPFNWENGKCINIKLKDEGPKILCMSACKDTQIAREFHEDIDTGAFTTTLLNFLSKCFDYNIHELHKNINISLETTGYKQHVSLSSSFYIGNNITLLDMIN